jgi:hypothetical protein
MIATARSPSLPSQFRQRMHRDSTSNRTNRSHCHRRQLRDPHHLIQSSMIMFTL